ncbi:phosphoethanolamine transferase [Halpernia sp.]|uniref:phosphoethanolamine transferase n=1 Tax=Halpernia sp. TaxID=2782209 RepID=UPI003A8D3E6C
MKEFFNRERIRKSKKSQYIIYCILFLILFIPNFFTLLYAGDLHGNLKMSLSYLILSLFVWLLPLLFLNVKNYFRLGLFFFLFAPLEIGFVKVTGVPINIGLMESILNTNFLEAKEQIFSNLPTLYFLILILIFYCYLLTFVNENSLKRKWKIALFSIFLFLNVTLYYNMFSLLPNYLSFRDKLIDSFNNTTKKYEKVFPANVVLNTIYAINSNIKNKNFAKEIENFSFNAKQKSINSENEIYILVIGESARRHNFHLYGYPRETTPELEKIKNLIPFTNVNSTATLTLLSVPQIITRANPENFDLQFKEKTILDIFHEANYYTAWIGTQSLSTPVIKRLERVCNYNYVLKMDTSSGNFYDGDILKNIQKVIDEKSNKKKFIIIHSLGSHFRYSNRYPSNFEKFKPNISKSGYSNIGLEYKKELINSYDNSIFYTDYFLSSIIKKVQKANAVSGLIYLSDHGENLYDDNKNFSHGSEKPPKFEYKIPYLVWFSEKYKDLYPNKVEALKKNKDKKASSIATFYSLSDMANISYKHSEEEINKSIFNLNYKEPIKRKILNSKKEVITVE